jgi:hypothetical protein
MTDQQRRNILGLKEKKAYVSPQLALARQTRESVSRGQAVLDDIKESYRHDDANRERLGLQPRKEVRVAEATAKIARGEMASDDQSKWGQYSPLKPKKS